MARQTTRAPAQVNTTLYICGPASGSLAFSFPQFQRAGDDSVFLSSSECELAERQTVFRLNRLSVNGSPALRVGIYRQVFEQGMNRLGHSFGAVFQFLGDVPRGPILAHTLMELLAVIQQGCTLESRFCGYERFSAFLRAEILPSFDGIVDQLNPSDTQPIVRLQLGPGEGLQCHSDTQPTSAEQVGILIDWFTSEPLALRCDTLLIGTQLNVGGMVRPVQFDAIASATGHLLCSVASSLQTKLADALRSVSEHQETIRSLQQESRQLTHDIQLAELESSTAIRRAEILEAKLRTLQSSWSRPAASEHRKPGKDQTGTPTPSPTYAPPQRDKSPSHTYDGLWQHTKGRGQTSPKEDRLQASPHFNQSKLSGDALANAQRTNFPAIHERPRHHHDPAKPYRNDDLLSFANFAKAVVWIGTMVFLACLAYLAWEVVSNFLAGWLRRLQRFM